MTTSATVRVEVDITQDQQQQSEQPTHGTLHVNGTTSAENNGKHTITPNLTQTLLAKELHNTSEELRPDLQTLSILGKVNQYHQTT